MNKFIRCGGISVALISLLLFTIANSVTGQTREKIELMYDDVWGSLYNPELDQCDKTPTITADGSVIDTLRASQQRWIAVSQDLLWSPRRYRLFVKDAINDHRYKGRIKFGDTIWVESPNPNINGKWVVHDLMNKKYKNAIDFLQTAGDGHLYNNNRLWDGKFKIISVYKINKSIDNNISKVKISNLINYVERPKLPQTIQCDSVKYLNIVNRIFSPDNIIRCHDKSVDNYWDIYYKIETKEKELKKIQHQIDSLKIEMHKYYKENRLYHKMIREKVLIIN
jgi:hypothetical protein